VCVGDASECAQRWLTYPGRAVTKCSFRVRSDRGDGGSEVVEGLGECGARVADGEGNELRPFSVSSEGRKERGVFLDLFVALNVAVEVHAKADLDEDESALCLVEHCQVCGGKIWDPSCMYEVHRRAVAVMEQLLSLFRGGSNLVCGGGPVCTLHFRRRRRDPIGCIWGLGRHHNGACGECPPA